jgi:hypothetical protein
MMEAFMFVLSSSVSTGVKAIVQPCGYILHYRSRTTGRPPQPNPIAYSLMKHAHGVQYCNGVDLGAQRLEPGAPSVIHTALISQAFLCMTAHHGSCAQSHPTRLCVHLP